MVPSTQGTEYSTANSQPRSKLQALSQAGVHFKNADESDDFNDIDEDASWQVERNISATQAWRMLGFSESKRTEDTWSTVRTQSQKGDTGNAKDLAKSAAGKSLNATNEVSDDNAAEVQYISDMDVEQDGDGDDQVAADSDDEGNMEMDSDEPELQEMAAAGKSTIKLVKVRGEGTLSYCSQ